MLGDIRSSRCSDCSRQCVPVWLLNCHSCKIRVNQGERIASFQIFDMDTKYFPYDSECEGQINSIGSEILGLNSHTKTLPKHEVDLNLDSTTLTDMEKDKLPSLVSEFLWSL